MRSQLRRLVTQNKTLFIKTVFEVFKEQIMTPYQQECLHYHKLDIEAAKQETIAMLADDIQEEVDTLLYVGGNDEKANEIIEEILNRSDWDEFINLMRVAVKSKNRSSDIWYQFLKKEIESYAEDEAVAQFEKKIALHREDGALRKGVFYECLQKID